MSESYCYPSRFAKHRNPCYNAAMCESLSMLLAAGWTQTRIAKAIGCTQAAVSCWASGKRKPGGVAVKALGELVKGVKCGQVEI